MDIKSKRTELISIILPTYNEKENIRDAITEIINVLGDPIEVIIVDDDSPDQTWNISSEMDDDRVIAIRRRNTRGLASAINRGIIESRGDIIGWMDADLSHPPSMLPQMLKALGQHDAVIASRYVEGGKDDRPFLRVFTSRLINGLASLVLGYGVKDYDSGFILMRRRVLDQVTFMPTGYGSYFIELVHACCRKGLSVHEVPYVFTDRTKGQSKSATSLLQFFIAGMRYVIRIFAVRFRRID